MKGYSDQDLSVACSYCDAGPGRRCGMVSDWARKPHAVRRRLGLAAAALAAFLLGRLEAGYVARHRRWCPCRGCEAARWSAG